MNVISQDTIYTALGILLFFIGIYGFFIQTSVLRKILAINIASVGVFMLLVATSLNENGSTDPVPHAMVLTGIVISVAATALVLYLTLTIDALNKQVKSVEDNESIP